MKTLFSICLFLLLNLLTYSLSAQQQLRVDVKTANVKHAGTASRIEIQVIGNEGASGWLHCDNSRNNHEKGKMDTYYLQISQELGEITGVRVRSNGSGKKSGWKLSYIKIYDETINKIYTASCEQWFTKDSTLERYLACK